MNNQLGMNVAGVRKLGKSLINDAETLEGIETAVTNKLGDVFWHGADATRFRNEWNSKHARALKQVAKALETAGQSALKNADQQDSTSD